MIKVEGHPGLTRDATGAIVNDDQEGFHAYHRSRQAALVREEKFNAMEQRVNQLETTVAQLKQMVIELQRRPTLGGTYA